MPQITVSIKNNHMLPTFKAVQALAECKAPGKVSWKLARILRDARAATALVEEALNKILDTYTVKDEDGKPVPVIENDKVVENKVKLTDPAAYSAEVEDLLNQESEFTTHTISEREIETLDGASGTDLELLIPFVDCGPQVVR